VEASLFEPGGERSSYCGPATDSSLFETFRQVCQLYDVSVATLINARMHCEAQCCGAEIISFDSGSVEPLIRVAAPDPAPAQDSFIRCLKNGLF
jgi:hypothetical protein